MIRHAGLIALRCGGEWRGALIEGPSGSGKSDLALRALAQGFALVADDQVEVWADVGRLYGRSPDVLAGLIEVRGQGVQRCPYRPFAPIDLVVSLAADPAAVERMPENPACEIGGQALPRLDLWPFEPGAPAKIGRALNNIGQDR